MRPKASLGQNFLTNTHIVAKIIDFAGLKHQDTVLEIGPGRGIMTMSLAKSDAAVIAVEKDDDLAEALSGSFASHPHIRIVHGDILELDLQSIVPAGSKLVANLPYNIATAVILRLVEIPSHYASITVMVQKEVGERICAPIGTRAYSGLSVLVRANFDPFPGFIVGPGNFKPQPKVDSMVIKLIPRQEFTVAEDLYYLKTVVFCAFNQRRKMLRNSWLGLPHMTISQLGALAEQAGISLERRPQDLSVDDFKRFSRVYAGVLAR